MAKPKVGDVVEFETSKGYAYALYTHMNEDFGVLLRVWNKLHAQPLRSFDELMQTSPSFSTFYPLAVALRQSLAKVVGHIEVPEALSQFPMFRTGSVNQKTNKVDDWWLWDGVNEWRVGQITPEQRSFPIRGVWNHTLLIDRIESGWTAETDRW